MTSLHKQISDNYSSAAAAHLYERNAYEAATSMQTELGSLAAQRVRQTAQLEAIPWYRPLKKSAIRASIANTEARLATVETKFVQTKSAAVLTSKRGAVMQTPLMMQSNVVLAEIKQTLEVRSAERAVILRTRHNARVDAHNQLLAADKLREARPSMAVEIFNEMVDEMNDRTEEQEELEKIDREIPRYGYTYGR